MKLAITRPTTISMVPMTKGERSVDDVRPSIEALSVVILPGDSGVVGEAVGEGEVGVGEVGVAGEVVRLHARLATVGRGLRPAELVSVLFPGHGDAIDLVRGVLRTEQWIERDGARRELLPAPAAVAAPAELVGA